MNHDHDHYAILGYFYLLLVLRVLKRRPGAQITPAEFVLIFLMGGVIILSTMGDDRSEINAITAVLTIGICHRIVSHVKQKFPKVALVLDGSPLVPLKDGQWQTETMHKTHISEMDVMSAARRKGAKTLREIKYAVLERNGAISVIKQSGQ